MLVTLIFGWAACGSGSTEASVPAAATTNAAQAAVNGATASQARSPRKPAQVPAAPASATACTVPVACAGTMSGSWCVDSFLPTETSSAEFGGVWSSGPDDVWAVGWRNTAQQSDASGFAFHWDGCTWSQAPISTSAGLNDVWGSGPDDVWIVGSQGNTWHWNGSAWAAVPTGASGTLNHVSGTGPSDVWAIGNAGLYHWDGSSWTADARVAVNAEDGFLGDLWAAAPDDVWIAEGLNARGSVAHYDGTTWTVTKPSPDTAFGLFGIWSGGGTTWAVGEGKQALRNTSGTWTQLQPPGGSAQGWINAMGNGGEVWVSGQSVARATGDAFQEATDAPAGFYPGLWLNGSQVWVGGISNAGAAVVMHRAR